MVEKVIVRCVIVIAALAPIWRRLYIKYFWASGRATVIRIDRQFTDAGSEVAGWGWVPTLEYHVAGQRWVFAKNYWQRIGSFFGGPGPRYSVGHEVEILYNSCKPWRFTYKNSWGNWIGAAIVTGVFGIAALVNLPPDV